MRLRRKPITTAICWLLCLLCMICIFSMSAQNAKQSDKTSSEVIKIILRITDPKFEELSPSEQQTKIDDMQGIVRKTTHFLIYALLGALFAQGYLCFSKTPLIVIPAAILSAALYASTDELHQTFIPGRSGELRDIVIDSSGAILGALVSYGITRLCARVKAKNGSRS